MDFVQGWGAKAELPTARFLGWLKLGASKFYAWRQHYGQAQEHNGKVPRDFWLEEWEKQAVLQFHREHPPEGYRRLTYMMLDAGVVAVSPATVYRVLKAAGALQRWNWKPSRKGTGFVQPLRAHEHWHTDISYVNVSGTFYYLCSLLDGMSRFIVHWELGERMTEAEVELIVERGREQYPGEKPRIISDNGPQFIARDFKEYLRLCGMTQVRTSPYYPQSNGKIERWHQSLKRECLRPKTPLNLAEARRLVGEYVEYYNRVRLHSAIGYVPPADKLAGREEAIWAERDRRLEAARAARKRKRQEAGGMGAGAIDNLAVALVG